VTAVEELAISDGVLEAFSEAVAMVGVGAGEDGH
jgi:hypothetical protein